MVEQRSPNASRNHYRKDFRGICAASAPVQAGTPPAIRFFAGHVPAKRSHDWSVPTTGVFHAKDQGAFHEQAQRRHRRYPERPDRYLP